MHNSQLSLVQCDLTLEVTFLHASTAHSVTTPDQGWTVAQCLALSREDGQEKKEDFDATRLLGVFGTVGWSAIPSSPRIPKASWLPFYQVYLAQTLDLWEIAAYLPQGLSERVNSRVR